MTHPSRTDPSRTAPTRVGLTQPHPSRTGEAVTSLGISESDAEIEGQQESPRLDLRLLIPALSAWAVLVAAVVHDVRTQLLGALACLLTGAFLLWLAGRSTRRGRRRERRWWLQISGLLALGLVATSLVLGASAAHRATEHAGTVPELAQERAVVTLTGVVLTEPRVITRGDERPDLVVLELRVTHVVGRGEGSSVGTPLVVFADKQWAGVPWRGTVTARARLGPPDPGDSVVAVATPLDPPTLHGEQGRVLAGVEHVRERLRQAVDPLPVDARALIPGLVIGDTSLTPPDLSDAMLATGMSHLSAVSGSNVAIVLGVAVLFCGWVGVPRRWRPLVALVCLVGFVLLCRPEPSVLRAGAMGVVGLIGLSASRRSVSLPALGTAVLVLLCWDPWLARSYGFALSTLATLGLVVFARPWGDAIASRLPRRLSLLGDAIAIPLAAQVVCAPVIVLLQGTVSTVAVLTNLLAAPFVAPTTIAGIGAALAGTVWLPLGVLVAWVAALPAWLIGAVARWGATVPMGTIGWVEGVAGAWLLTLLTVAVLALGPWLRWHARRRPGLAWAPLLLGLALVWPTPGRHGWPPQDWVVAGCDVGQGDAFMVPTGPGRVVLIDTGPDPALLATCLDLLGVEQVDGLVLTHFHADHVGGIDALLGRVPVAAAYVTPVRDPPADADQVLADLAAANIPTYAVTSGDSLVWGDSGQVRAEVVWPPPERAGSGSLGANDASVVLDLTVSTATGDLPQAGGRGAEPGDGIRMLFTGDIEPGAARGVRRALAGAQFDVLKVAHHGSAAQDESLVTAIGATVALIGVGADNTFGHPSRTALSLLAEAGTVVLRTDRDGAYALVLTEAGLGVTTQK
ncbi:ComEC/Rec2 family competence protein [Ornithinimicrobium faecis]|uniref:ComEC/Rec2 family competence protein n=1 Tax=Ornithinimicrobium faecis TaxID=2934158 RepID=UPI0021196AEC|nr:ComEC/Rec2 family competence protein [Ornithinimicrobium sp. HY1745]